MCENVKQTTASNFTSFGFNKKINNKVVKGKVLHDEDQRKDDTELDYVTSVEESKVHSTKGDKLEPGELVIPLIRTNNWRQRLDGGLNGAAPQKQEQQLDDLSAQAVKELLKEAKQLNEGWDERTEGAADIAAIPLLMKNKVPEGFETDDRLDVSIRPESAAPADYDQVPIEEYGKAMLRGMGWKPGEGIGKGNKQVVPPVEAVLRPKGMGLGADRRMIEKSLNTKPKKRKPGDAAVADDDDVLRKGCCVVVTKGVHQDLYGKYGHVEGVDEDNARFVVRLALGSQVITISQFQVKVVGQKDYDKYSKYINKRRRYKEAKEAERLRKPQEEEVKGHGERSSSRHGSDDAQGSRSSSNGDAGSQKRKHDDRDRKEASHSRSRNPSWLHPQIRVRFIDKQYQKGKFYNTKHIERISDVRQSMVETVVPRHESAHVLVVSGKYKGKIGAVLSRDKSRSEATVQFLLERDCVKALDYDAISEYVGETSDLY
ncbi:PREDICTED: G patch domain and KOW motifs-containing protein-like [Priapulus caudatus]|uniref:G patch domain and KOW motifs-containing protein-like n=1 Tax=Priapulus caudatus TaxID=37621 RepID=A0ABM1F2P9_PRICU|nr:PREDICTED: G patch domain and KOW motifs-containing protein-like [Priapulus caudatus]